MKLTAILPVLICLFWGCGNNNRSSEKTPLTDSAAQPKEEKQSYLNDCKAYLQTAKKSDSLLLTQMEVNIPSANKAIKAFADFANFCHSDSLAPIYLIKCAQVARAVNNIPQAKIVLDKCIEDYPDFKDRPAALFLLAQLYDDPTYLNNEQEAKKLYQDIIDNYPKSDWAMSARGAILFIGKTDEEMMKEFRKKNKS